MSHYKSTLNSLLKSLETLLYGILNIRVYCIKCFKPYTNQGKIVYGPKASSHLVLRHLCPQSSMYVHRHICLQGHLCPKGHLCPITKILLTIS